MKPRRNKSQRRRLDDTTLRAIRDCDRSGIYLLDESDRKVSRWVLYSRLTGKTLIAYDLGTRKWQTEKASGHLDVDGVLALAAQMAADERH
jgi:hypothetical protein